MPRAGRSGEIDGVSTAKPESNSSSRKGKTSNSNGHDCNICRKSNMTLSGLKIHLLSHSGEKPYLCTVCDKRFTCSSNLKKHQRIHNKDYIYACEVCGKTCSDPSNMKKHMTVHSGEKAYVCPSCGKSYSYAQSLRQHMDDVHVENGEKRNKNKRKGHFPCPECGKVFGYYWRCSLHQARVHAVDRPYKCPECGKCFARETILNKHLQTHEKPYACGECDRRFSFRDQLHKHSRTHSGERPYQCNTCLKAFSQRGSLTEHMRTHTGQKPFVCQICGMKFASSSSLRRHERKVKSCFPAPPGEEIPMGSMYPRKAIYVPTPAVNIPRVETRPVVDTQGIQNSYMRENPYFGENPSSSSSMSEISTDNNLFAENGLSPAHSTTESNYEMHNQTGNNLDVNGNYEATMVPSSQISMVVRCDKDGKISVLPVPLNETSQFADAEGELNKSAANEPMDSVAPNTYSREINTEPTRTSKNCYPSYTDIPMSTGRITNGTDSCCIDQSPTHAIVPPPTEHHSHTIHHHSRSLPTNQYRRTVKKRALPTAVITNSTLVPSNPPSTASTKSFPSPSNQITTSNRSSPYTIITKTNPKSPDNILLENRYQQQSTVTPCIVMNGEYTTYHKSQSYVITSRACTNAPQSPPANDVNNNTVNTNGFVIKIHPSAKYSVVDVNGNKNLSRFVPNNNARNCTNNLDIPVPSNSVVADTNDYYQSPIVYGEPMQYDGHQQSLPHILLPSSMTRRPSTIMEPSTNQACLVKMETEDVKPVIGIDVPAFNQ